MPGITPPRKFRGILTPSQIKAYMENKTHSASTPEYQP